MSEHWYDKHHKANESPEFVAWWVKLYGLNGIDYWARRGFALMGWNARLKLSHEELA
jgi:hypothetical protein